MILFISNLAESLPVVFRLKREGTDARIYVHSPRYRKNYDGLLAKVKIGELKKAVESADIIVFDSNRRNERARQDIVFLKMFGLKAGTPAVFGAVGDKLKKDHRVIGAGRIELEGLAEKMGFAIPEKKIEGAGISTEVWVGPRGPEHFNRTFEDKRLMTGNLGPAIGSQSNTVWIEEDLSSIGIPELCKMAAYLKANNYIGPCNANLIIKDKVPYFLKWSLRFSYDAIYCLFELLKGKLTDFFEKDFKVDFHTGYAASQRLSIPPFPYADKNLLVEFAKDTTIPGELSKMPRFWGQDIYNNIDHLACAGSDGILGIVTGRGNSLGAAWGQTYRAIDKMKLPADIQYRPDGFKSAQKRMALFNKQSRRLKIA